jgi:hypothetical protein|tara:strand:- start:226 stop:456 length:231 start_codon:yes stop_codon:yes gene_type:complete
MKDKITKSEAKKLCDTQGFTFEMLNQMFDITREPRKYTFTVENERQYAIKVLNVISNLNQKQRERVLQRALKTNKI